MSEKQAVGRKPRDETIRREVLRRINAGEPITYRAIREAVGGSPATIKRVLEKLDLGTDPRGNAQREVDTRERLREAGSKLMEAKSYVKGAKEAGEALARDISSTLSTVKDAHGMLIREVETLRVLMGEIRRELAANRSAADPLMEARLKKANAENGKMAQMIDEMKRKLNEAGIEEY